MKTILYIMLTLWMPTTQASEFIHEECDLSFENGISPDLKNKVNESILLLDRIQGNQGSPVHHEMFGGPVHGRTYCKFLKENVVMFSWMVKKDQRRAKRIGVAAQNFLGIIEISSIALSTTRAEFASLLLHEALHANGHRHIRCPKPFHDEHGNPIIGLVSGKSIAGKWGCDSDANGAYGAQYVWAKNLDAYCVNCSEIDVSEAVRMGEMALNRIIDRTAQKKLTKELQVD